MSGPKDGGYAFPSLTYDWPKSDLAVTVTDDEAPGMTLRDYFAAKALQGICACSIPGPEHRPSNAARDAYAYADAMLAERAK